MSAKVTTLLQQRLHELTTVEPARSNWSKITEWHARTRPLIAQFFPSHIDQFDRFIEVQWTIYPRVIALGGRQQNHSDVDAAERRANDGIVKAAKEKLVAHLNAILELEELKDGADEAGAPAPDAKQSRNIFVVHGHNEEMKQSVARTLLDLGLNPIILHEQPNSGRTIIEKFEVNSDVSFAVVILSPDDMAFSASGDAKQAKPRPRQNVVLELGYFVGKLGRSRVFSLKLGEDLEVPSDLSGVVYQVYDQAGYWRYVLVRELKAAGYPADANLLLSSSG